MQAWACGWMKSTWKVEEYCQFYLARSKVKWMAGAAPESCFSHTLSASVCKAIHLLCPAASSGPANQRHGHQPPPPTPQKKKRVFRSQRFSFFFFFFTKRERREIKVFSLLPLFILIYSSDPLAFPLLAPWSSHRMKRLIGFDAMRLDVNVPLRMNCHNEKQ